jgi:hypothetical protein
MMRQYDSSKKLASTTYMHKGVVPLLRLTFQAKVLRHTDHIYAFHKGPNGQNTLEVALPFRCLGRGKIDNVRKNG